MSTAAPLQTQAAKAQPLSSSNHAGLLLQRKCACGSSKSPLAGMCDDCRSHAMQRKLAIGASNDPLEREADRIADQVLAAPANAAVRGAPPHIQRFTGQPSAPAGTAAPASVDRVLASPGMPLGPVIQQDMEQRFGYDFSRVRVHSGAAAEQSARDVNANAYTVGHNMVFGAGRFVPGTTEGRRLIAHELTHVVQQAGWDGLRVAPSNKSRGRIPISYEQPSGAERLAGPTANDTPMASVRAPIVGAGLAIARKPRTGATAPAPPAVREMTREEARTVLAAYIAMGGVDDTLAAMNAIVETLDTPSTTKNWKMRLRVLTAAFSLLDEGAAASVLKALTKPVGAKQKHLRERFDRLDWDFRRPLLEILRERARAKPAREEKKADEPSEDVSLPRKAKWIELNPGVFAYVASAGMTIDDVAAYLSGHPDMPDALAKLNGVTRKTPLPGERPVVVPIEFIDREKAIREMPGNVRSRIASARADLAQQAQNRRYGKVKSGHPLGPGAVGLIPLTTAPIPTGVLEALKYPAGFIVGLLEGAGDAVVDLFKGAAEMIKTITEVLYRLITGNLGEISKMLTGWIEKLKLAWKNRGEIAADFMDKWEAKDDWDRGRFQGKVLGWVMMTALIVIVTAGAGAIPQIAGKWKFVIDALKLADRAGDLGTYVGAVSKLPGKAVDVVRRKLGLKAGQVADETAEKSTKEAIEKGTTRGAKELADEALSAKHTTPDGDVIKITKDGKIWICTNPCDQFAQSYRGILEKNKSLANELEKIRTIADPKTRAEALGGLKTKADKAPITELQALSTEGSYRFVLGGKVHRGNALRLTPDDWKHILEGHVQSTFDASKRGTSAVSTVFKGTPAQYLEILEEAVKNKAVITALKKAEGVIVLKLRNQEWILQVDLLEGAVKTFHARRPITNKHLFDVINVP